MERVFIAIGSNKGRRSDNVIDALRKMERGIAIGVFLFSNTARGRSKRAFLLTEQ